MIKRCIAYAHPRQHAINLSIADGVSFRAITAGAGVSHMAVRRHKCHCLAALFASVWYVSPEISKHVQTSVSSRAPRASDVTQWERDRRKVC